MIIRQAHLGTSSYSSILMAAIISMSTIGIMRTARADVYWAYVGTYTQGNSQGIYVARFDTTTGQFEPAQLAAATENPSFLAIHPSHASLYAVGETGDYDGQESGFVRAFRIDPASGGLTQLNTQSSGGAGPCHLVVDATGRTVLVANYGGGSVASIGIADDGRLLDRVSTIKHTGSSVNAQRQEAPHAHSINLDPDNHFAFAADLGLDKILIYRFDPSSGELSRDAAPPVTVIAPGSGPRHFAFHPTGAYAFVINELASTVVAFRYDASSGTLTEIQQISTLPADYKEPSYTAEVVVHPSGRFVYGSNRGHDSIAVFRTDAGTGRLQTTQIAPTEGKTPRNFAIDPTGQFLLAENQGSNTIVVFRIDPDSGRLTPTGHRLQVPMPVCLRFVPAG